MDEENGCFRCGRGEEEVKLLNAVYGNEIVKVCEECGLIEDIPVIRKPSSQQLIESEKPFTVRQRLNRMAGLKEKDDSRELMKKLNLDNLRKPKDFRQVLDEKFLLARKRNVPVNLIDNYNWLIMMERKKKKIDRKQLADAIGEPEIAIKMIENKEMPDDASRIINKIEQYLGIKLKGGDRGDERAGEIVREKLGLKIPMRVLSFNKEVVKNITIADLKRMKDDKQLLEKVGKKEKEEEKVQDAVLGKEKSEKEPITDKKLIDSEIEFEE
jgi:ribosome-binding protein aMBF1 (putative translation factor)